MKKNLVEMRRFIEDCKITSCKIRRLENDFFSKHMKGCILIGVICMLLSLIYTLVSYKLINKNGVKEDTSDELEEDLPESSYDWEDEIKIL